MLGLLYILVESTNPLVFYIYQDLSNHDMLGELHFITMG